MKVKSLSRARLLATPWTAAYQAPSPWDFPGKSTGVGYHCLLRNKAEIDVFLERSCFFRDPEDVGNLISGSSAFSKTSLNIGKFTVHILLKPGLENFEHYFTSM